MTRLMAIDVTKKKKKKAEKKSHFLSPVARSKGKKVICKRGNTEVSRYKKRTHVLEGMFLKDQILKQKRIN